MMNIISRIFKSKTEFERRQKANLTAIKSAKSPRQKHKPLVENRKLVINALKGI